MTPTINQEKSHQAEGHNFHDPRLCFPAGENILMDALNGDCVPVDFSCLFDRGLTLERAELLPFRLTQKMLDGFGPAGPDGAFKRCCEITLQVRPKVLQAHGQLKGQRRHFEVGH